MMTTVNDGKFTAAESGEETVKTHISRIRNRLKNITEFNIVTIKGLGYKADICKG